ncbi:tetratricopeptide repeat-containing sulfotransferase family protein [Thalassotalea piscium]
MTIKNALHLFNTHKINEGKRVLEKILQGEPRNTQALQLLVKAGFSSKNYPLAEKYLVQLLSIEPLSNQYFQALVDLYSFQSRWQDIANLYIKLLEKQENNTNTLFNCGYYLKLAGKFEQALACYKQALDKGIDRDFEVSLNMATIYSEYLSDPDSAIDILTTAIKKHPKQDSLLYNLANLYEQLGDKAKASLYFKSTFTLNPNNYTALARLADINKVIDKNDHLVEQLADAFNKASISPSDKINIGYALGKVYDDCGEYSTAFNYYCKANDLDKQTLPKYDPEKYEDDINQIITTFDRAWFDKVSQEVSTLNDCPPIFICGMFRSGSTLCEQILSAHSGISMGGEQEFFHRLVVNNFPEFPSLSLADIHSDKVRLLKLYYDEIEHFKLKGNQLTDKRPDNFLYLGIIKTLMPKAKIIWTTRSMLDNCLSVYFLRLGASMPYATEIKNSIHYYQQQEKLMLHWQSLFPEDIVEFNYDELISSPESQTRQLLSFLDLSWEDKCLKFYQHENQIKTASVWQVRQPLYKSSSGRCNNYQPYLDESLSL